MLLAKAAKRRSGSINSEPRIIAIPKSLVKAGGTVFVKIA
jgi:hypothetical protein